MSPSPDYELFARCNFTELFQLCRRLGLPVAPSLSKDKLIALLLGEEESDPEVRNVIDSWRHGLMGFVLDNWNNIRAQLSCPAKTGDPRACFNCVDAQVISCVVDNPVNEHLIQLKRKNDP